MARARTVAPKLLIAGVAFLGCSFLLPRSATFIPFRPGPFQKMQMATAAGGAGLFASAPPAFADGIDDASARLVEAVYPLVEKYDWIRAPGLVKWMKSQSSKWDPQNMAVAMDKLIEAGMAMDQNLVVKAVQIHEQGIQGALAKNPKTMVLPKEKLNELVSATAHMMATAGTSKLMSVYKSLRDVGIDDLNKQLEQDFSRGSIGSFADTYTSFYVLAEQVRVEATRYAAQG